VIIIAHDRHLLEATVDRLWLVSGGTVAPYDGDLSDYRSHVTGGQSDRREKREADKASKADRRREAAQRRAAMEPLAREIKNLEGLVERTRKRMEAIDRELADPTLYDRNAAQATKLAKERSELVDRLAVQEDRWLELSAEYEQGTAA